MLSSFSTCNDIVAIYRSYVKFLRLTNNAWAPGIVDMSLSVYRVSGERESTKRAEERLEVREDNIVRF